VRPDESLERAVQVPGECGEKLVVHHPSEHRRRSVGCIIVRGPILTVSPASNPTCRSGPGDTLALP
jgi:hypothetical protein